jgi:hypothetical protein
MPSKVIDSLLRVLLSHAETIPATQTLSCVAVQKPKKK